MPRLADVEARAAAATEVERWAVIAQGQANESPELAVIVSGQFADIVAEFIAAARSDVPALCALVRQLGDALTRCTALSVNAALKASAEERNGAALAAYREWTE